MKAIYNLYIVLFTISLFSCVAEDNVKEYPYDSNAGTFSADLNGYSWNGSTKNCFLIIENATLPGGGNYIGKSINLTGFGAATGMGYRYVSIVLGGLSIMNSTEPSIPVGTYDVSSLDMFASTVIDGNDIFSGPYIATSGYVNITENNISAKTISGNFAFTVFKATPGISYPVTNGIIQDLPYYQINVLDPSNSYLGYAHIKIKANNIIVEEDLAKVSNDFDPNINDLSLSFSSIQNTIHFSFLNLSGNLINGIPEGTYSTNSDYSGPPSISISTHFAVPTSFSSKSGTLTVTRHDSEHKRIDAEFTSYLETNFFGDILSIELTGLLKDVCYDK